MAQEEHYAAFSGSRLVASGTLTQVLPVLKSRFDKDPSDSTLVFGDETGQIDFDLRGAIEDIVARETAPPVRGRGRPRLGVRSREISLLPRQWKWLERQPKGLSASIRMLVDRAMASQTNEDKARAIRSALGGVLGAIAGNRPNFEEAMRALYAGDSARVETLTARWPKDIRAYVARRLGQADAARGGVDGKSVVAALYERVWSKGEYEAIGELIGASYRIHSDPGDAWEGQSLDREQYEERVRYSRTAFPDLVFELQELVEEGARVSVRWSAEGTQRGDLRDVPATGKRLRFWGQTMYELEEGRVIGHWQVVDRLGFVEQLRS